MAISLAIFAGLLGLSIIIRVVRLALAVVLVGLVFDLFGGHATTTLTHLMHLL